MKQITSLINFKYGKIQSIPDLYIDKNQVEVYLNKIADNAVEVVFSFDGTNFSQDQATEYSNKATETIALVNSLKIGIHSEYSHNVKTHWQETNKPTTQGKVSVVVRAAVASEISCEIAGCLGIDIDNAHDSTDHQQSLECFNRALQHKESGQQDISAIAIWLRLSWEALQLELGISEQQLRAKIVKDNVLSNKVLGDFEYSVGTYYVHKKRKSGGNKKPISIQDCVSSMQKILLQFI